MSERSPAARILVTVLVVLGVAALTRLGFWQLSRHDEKAAFMATLEARHDQPPLGVEALDRPGAEIEFHRAQLSGTFNADEYVLVAGRYLGGLPGYHLVMPLHLEGQRLTPLVNRGWIAQDDVDQAVVDLAGPATVLGVVRDSVPHDAAAPESPDGQRWRMMAPAAMTEALGVEAPSWFVIAGEPLAEGRSPDPRQRPATGYTISVAGRPHLEYAATWFLLAAVLGGGALAVAIRGRLAGTVSAP
ncbi:MAG: SURF1 family protein [Alphaproteobacteria bacterium]|nr:SURF1 family protein [Alphaproteobacteria bacterium]